MREKGATVDTSEKDAVKEARDVLARCSRVHALDDRSPGKDEDVSWLLESLANEAERLRRGEFTSEEFQNLCHNTDVQAGFNAFADGCEAYQQKLFGRCRKGSRA